MNNVTALCFFVFGTLQNKKSWTHIFFVRVGNTMCRHSKFPQPHQWYRAPSVGQTEQPTALSMPVNCPDKLKRLLLAMNTTQRRLPVWSCVSQRLSQTLTFHPLKEHKHWHSSGFLMTPTDFGLYFEIILPLMPPWLSFSNQLLNSARDANLSFCGFIEDWINIPEIK